MSLLTCNWRNHHSLELVGNRHMPHTSFGGEPLLGEVLLHGQPSLTSCAFQAEELIRQELTLHHWHLTQLRIPFKNSYHSRMGTFLYPS